MTFGSFPDIQPGTHSLLLLLSYIRARHNEQEDKWQLLIMYSNETADD